jgi:FMN reductase [NAD(P)H]
MNETIHTLLNHRSIRSYKDQPISDEDLDLIIRSAQAAPSSINGQHVSLIVVKDKEKKALLSRLSGNQVYIEEAPIMLVFCMDFYRAKLAANLNEVDFLTTDRLEATLVGSIDVGLAMGNAIAAAESLGLGIVPIGSVRNEPTKVAELLDLPDYVFPLCGLLIGHPLNHSALKPRFQKEAVAFIDAYNPNLDQAIKNYDDVMSNYMLDRTNGASSRNWSQTISDQYKKASSREILQAMAKKQFKNK